MDSGDLSEAILEKGLRVRVQPRLAHIFFGLDDALVVEYSRQYYDQKDAVFVDFSDVSA